MWSENSPMSPLCLRSVCFILSERPTLYRMPFHTCHSHQHDMYLNATETSSPLLYVLASLIPDQGKDVMCTALTAMAACSISLMKTLSVTPAARAQSRPRQ